MSRSPLAYPLTRGIDGESGGAADLQTDIMRFMAILSLCLLAIFALVQSLPIEARIPPVETPPVVAVAEPEPAPPEPVAPEPVTPKPVQETVALTRPKWVSTFQPIERPAPQPVPQVQEQTHAAAQEQDGFSLRFESDIALTRLVATGQVGFYAINAGRAQRMTVSDSRISFWDASTPNTFHEMDAATVPRSVVDALRRSGADTGGVDWGVTLPGKLSSQLATLMQQHEGGALIIRADGNLERESG